ncbi:hypothetical protein V9T40_003701 [Parthenolecanium corni]|uniref:PPPDE domain-containing protein n=1 Tax=Parthenolecanium corni TaxID=536013 RepID=A0AAN9TU18_9HEMI
METGNDVKLYMYDLSLGFAYPMSWIVMGKQLEGVWHTSTVVFDKEIYFGRDGIKIKNIGETDFGKSPGKIVTLGSTSSSEADFYEYVAKLGAAEFAPGTYSLLKHNCNTFSNVLSNFLVGQGIQEDILQLPDDVVYGGISRMKDITGITAVTYSANQMKHMLDNVEYTQDINMTDNDVQLYMYDVTLGWAQPLSWFLVGKRLEAVWHTSIVVFEKEFHFGRGGIITSTPGETDFGDEEDRIEELGTTYVPEGKFYSYLDELKLDKFAGLTRLTQAGAVYGAYKVTQSLMSRQKAKKEEKEEKSGPNWLEIGGAVAGMATVAAAFSSFMNEQEKNKSRSNALGWNYDSDSD